MITERNKQKRQSQMTLPFISISLIRFTPAHAFSSITHSQTESPRGLALTRVEVSFGLIALALPSHAYWDQLEQRSSVIFLACTVSQNAQLMHFTLAFSAVASSISDFCRGPKEKATMAGRIAAADLASLPVKPKRSANPLYLA